MREHAGREHASRHGRDLLESVESGSDETQSKNVAADENMRAGVIATDPPCSQAEAAHGAGIAALLIAASGPSRGDGAHRESAISVALTPSQAPNSKCCEPGYDDDEKIECGKAWRITHLPPPTAGPWKDEGGETETHRATMLEKAATKPNQGCHRHQCLSPPRRDFPRALATRDIEGRTMKWFGQ